MKTNHSEAPLAEELPYWEFFDLPKPHAVLADGSLAAGLKLNLVDVECFDEAATNQFTAGLRSALNSISEGITVQFYIQVRSDYSDLIDRHVQNANNDAPAIIKKIANFREARLREDQNAGRLYRPHLFVFLRSKSPEVKKVSVLKKKELFSTLSSAAYEEAIEVLTQNLENLASAFQAMGLGSKSLQRGDFIDVIYQFLNPKRSLSEPSPKVRSVTGPQVEQEQLSDANWLADPSPRGLSAEQLKFEG